MEHGMDKEKMNIYANVHSLNIHDVRTEAENIRIHQTPQHTGSDSGSDSVRNRRYRAAVVCLVLLCVLLLTAVIVLGVYIHTNYTQETHQLLTNMQLTKERDELLSNNSDLIKNTDQLHQEKNELLKSIQRMDGWIYYQSNLYFISSEKKSWTESRRYCTERGADLIIINNRKEQDFVKKISANGNVWIGLTDSDVEGRWKWVDGSTLSSRFWNPQEPDGHRRENCVLTHSPGWADYPCSDLFLWICEKSILK